MAVRLLVLVARITPPPNSLVDTRGKEGHRAEIVVLQVACGTLEAADNYQKFKLIQTAKSSI